MADGNVFDPAATPEFDKKNRDESNEKESDVEVEFIRPTSQVDLEARQATKKDEPPPLVVTENPSAPDPDDAYVGVDEIYKNHANDTEAPLFSDEGPDAQAEEDFAKSFEKPDHEKLAAEKKAAEKKAAAANK